MNNIINHSADFYWSYNRIDGFEQQGYEIEFGTDTDWVVAELWDPEIAYTTDTTITYMGSPLTDGETYFVRIRQTNGPDWSDWYETSFRMNTPPEVPVQLSPRDSVVVDDAQPYFWVLNSFDAEGDDLTYDYLIANDCLMVFGSDIPQQMDSTGWQIDSPLSDNDVLLWNIRAFDGFEYSELSDWAYFFANTIEQFPAAFNLSYPPDTEGSRVCDFPVHFQWNASYDYDPFDTVHYDLQIAVDPTFTFMVSYDDISATEYFADLEFGAHYWWKVAAIDTKGNTTWSTTTADFLTWKLGDANGDNEVNVGDAVYIINYIFKGGAAPAPVKTGDVNGDCVVNVGDAVSLINYVFKSGPAPVEGCNR